MALMLFNISKASCCRVMLELLFYAWPASIFLVMLLVLLAARCVTWRGCFHLRRELHLLPSPFSISLRIRWRNDALFLFLKPVSICKASVAFKLQVSFGEPSLLSFFWNRLHSVQTGIIYQYKHFNASNVQFLHVSCIPQTHMMYFTPQCERIFKFEAENVVKFNHSKPIHQCLWSTLIEFSKE